MFEQNKLLSFFKGIQLVDVAIQQSTQHTRRWERALGWNSTQSSATTQPTPAVVYVQIPPSSQGAC